MRVIISWMKMFWGTNDQNYNGEMIPEEVYS